MRSFCRFFSALVLFATGGLAAGAKLPPSFDPAPPEVAATAAPAPDTTTTTVPPVDETATTVPPVDETTTTVPPVDKTTTTVPPVDETTTTTTTTAPDGPPGVVDPVPVPVRVPDPIAPTADPALTPPTKSKPVKPVKRAKPPAGVPAPVPSDTPPAAPVDGDAPSVCAAAATKVCGPAEAAPTAGDNSHAARVQRCQDWWNSLAQAFDQNKRPEWAARAREIAGRCEAMITRWEEAQQRWEERRKEKGDHNRDGRPDNGRRNKGAKAQKVPRHSEGRH
jgi:hypothetical protein